MAESGAQSQAPYLIVGLGNPGPKYAQTRHNAGFMVLDELARRHGLRLSRGQANAETVRGAIHGAPVILAKPLTYMNNSGQAVAALARFYRLPTERVLVVVDDFDLPLGTLRLREKGSPGGHNGLKSIIAHLGTERFPRLRVGVSRPIQMGGGQVSHVLGRFSKEEWQVMEQTIPRATDAVESILRDGIQRTMNIYNSRDDGRPTMDDEGSLGAQQPGVGDESVSRKENRWVARLRSLYSHSHNPGASKSERGREK